MVLGRSVRGWDLGSCSPQLIVADWLKAVYIPNETSQPSVQPPRPRQQEAWFRFTEQTTLYHLSAG
jgi:hypothetical protein